MYALYLGTPSDLAVMGTMHIPRPPETSPDGFPIGQGRWAPFRYGGSARSPSLPGRRPKRKSKERVLGNDKQKYGGVARTYTFGKYLKRVSPESKRGPF